VTIHVEVTMSFSIAPLLIHSDDVPAETRAALRAALSAPADARSPLLETAARALHRAVPLDCADVRELVGL
jgi:hypothetical protein